MTKIERIAPKPNRDRAHDPFCGAVTGSEPFTELVVLFPPHLGSSVVDTGPFCPLSK